MVVQIAYIITVLGCLLIIQAFLHSDYTDNAFLIIQFIFAKALAYMPVVIKIQIFNEFMVAILQFIYTPLMPRINNHWKYIYSVVVKGMVRKKIIF